MGSALETIFIPLAGVNDDELYRTVISAFKSAANPERVKIGAVFQSDDVDKYAQQISVVEGYLKEVNLSENFKYKLVKLTNVKSLPTESAKSVPKEETTNVGIGRCLASSMASGEDYLLQLDGHCYFEPEWDSRLIDVYKEIQQWHGSDRFVFSGYPPGYRYVSETEVETIGDCLSLLWYTRDARWQDLPGTDGSNFKNELANGDKFVYGVRVAAGFIFGGKDFAADTGADCESLWGEDDILQSNNLYNRGYSFILPIGFNPRIYHLYNHYVTEHAGKRTSFTEYWSLSAIDDMHRHLAKVCKTNEFASYAKYARLEVLDDDYGYIKLRALSDEHPNPSANTNNHPA